MKKVKFSKFRKFWNNFVVFSKNSAQASEAVDFLNIFLWFLGFWGSFSYEKRNIAAVLRAVVKSHKGLKGAKAFACVCAQEEISKIYQNLQGRDHAGFFLL